MPPLDGLKKGVTKDPNPPATDTEVSPVLIPEGTLLVTTKTTNETIVNVDKIIDYLSGDAFPDAIPQNSIDGLISDLNSKSEFKIGKPLYDYKVKNSDEIIISDDSFHNDSSLKTSLREDKFYTVNLNLLFNTNTNVDLRYSYFLATGMVGSYILGSHSSNVPLNLINGIPDQVLSGQTDNDRYASLFFRIKTPKINSPPSQDGSFYVGLTGSDVSGISWNNDGTKVYISYFFSAKINQYSVSNPFDVSSTVTLDGLFYVGNEDVFPSGIEWNNNGTKMYIVGSSSDIIYQYSVSTPFDITSTVTFDGSFSVASQDTSPTAMAWNNDGTKVCIIGISSNSIHQYSVSTPFDVTSTVIFDGSFSVVSQDGSPQDIEWNNNGTKMYITGDVSNSIHQYSVSTPFDITSTVTLDGSFSVASQETSPTAMAWNSNGTKVYITGTISNNVHQYSVSTPFDVSSTVALGGSFNFENEDSFPAGMTWNNNGTKMYITGDVSVSIHQYSVSTPFDVSSTVTLDGSFSVAPQDGSPKDMAWNNDGTKVYIIGIVSDSMFQYSVSIPFDITSTVTFDGSFSVVSQDITPIGITWNTDGTKVYMLGFVSGMVYQYSVSTPFDVTSTVTLDGNFSFISQENDARCFSWNSNGTRIYIGGFQNDQIHQYSVSTPFDVTSTVTLEDSFNIGGSIRSVTFNDNGTKLYQIDGFRFSVIQYSLHTEYDIRDIKQDSSGSFSVASQDTLPIGMAWNNDGTKVYIVGTSSDNIHQYSVSIPFDVSSTVTFDGSFSIISQDLNPSGMTWNDNGTKVYIVGTVSNSVHQYSVSTPFDITSTVTFDGSFSVASQDILPTEVTWNNNGTKMYITGDVSNSIHQYSVSIPFDIISTVTFDGSFSVTSQDLNPTSITWNSNGTKVYIVGGSSDSIYQYSVSTPFDITSTVTLDGSFSVTSQETSPTAIAWNSNGTKVYIVGGSSNSIHQYSVSTPFSILNVAIGDFIFKWSQNVLSTFKTKVLGGSELLVYESG